MARIHPADEQATHDLTLTAQQSGRTRAADVLLLIVLSLFLLGFGIAILVLPQEQFSEQENRTLQTLPAPSLSWLTDNELSQDIAGFYADQFPARETFVGIKTVFEMTLWRMENNGVLIGKQGHLIKRLEYTEDGYDNIRKNLAAVATLDDSMAQRGIPVTLAIAPRGIDVLTAYLPDYYDTTRAEAAWAVVREAADAGGITPLSFTDRLRTAAATDDTPVWFRTDHHWTPWGAYLAYTQLCETLGCLPLSPAALTAEVASTAFYGTTYSSAGIPWAAPDTLTFYHTPHEDSYVCEIVDTGKTFTGFYDRSYLDTKDKYSALIGGNNGHVRITDTRYPDKPTLLVIKDSFAHAMMPYLAQNFNLEILDLRYWRGSVSDLADEVGAAHILILMGLDSLASAPTLELLRYGLS